MKFNSAFEGISSFYRVILFYFVLPENWPSFCTLHVVLLEKPSWLLERGRSVKKYREHKFKLFRAYCQLKKCCNSSNSMWICLLLSESQYIQIIKLVFNAWKWYGKEKWVIQIQNQYQQIHPDYERIWKACET